MTATGHARHVLFVCRGNICRSPMAMALARHRLTQARLDGRVELAKRPSPFDLTQLCVSFVPETCGRSVPYRITKHCLTTRGF